MPPSVGDTGASKALDTVEAAREMAEIHKAFDGAFDGIDCLAIAVDAQGVVRLINRYTRALLGFADTEPFVSAPLDQLLPEHAIGTSLPSSLHEASEASEASEAILCDIQTRAGARIPILWRISRRPFAEARMRLLIGIEAHATERRPPLANVFQTVSDHFSGSIIICNPDNSMVYVNPALTQMTGYAPEEVLGETPRLFKSGQTADSVYRELWGTLAADGIWRGEFINRRKDGALYPESKTISAIRDPEGRIRYYLAIGEDLSQRRDFQQRIDRLLTLDQLTGLFNRAAFLARLDEALDRARPSDLEIAVLHVDLDDFYLVNDALGTTEADRTLFDVGSRLQQALRMEDALARIGHDKFAFLLEQRTASSALDVDEVAERVLECFHKPFANGDEALFLTASIGVARFPRDGDRAGELLAHAMNATEIAKRGGGNNVHHFDTATASGEQTRRELRKDLQGAVARQEFVLHYQPQLNLRSGIVVGLEALIRWQHPQRGFVMPGNFIPLVEESRLVVDVGNWVLSEGCRQLRAWLDAGLPPVKLALNLSARHFLIPSLPAHIAEMLAAHRIEPHLIELEITEGAMMQDVNGAIRSMTELKEIGVRISLDDFGTGYSSLAYLSRFPIDVVKIDQSFVRDITDNPVNAAIAQATIAMSHKLGKTVLAEGVETEAQMHYLRRNECDEMQGYYFSRPLPAADIATLLREGRGLDIAQDEVDAVPDTVLFVDDEANILASIRRTLRREGYTVLCASSAAEAFSLLARHPVQVIVSDQRMPGMNGTELLSRVKDLYPRTVRMVLSGYSELSAVTDAINKGAVYRFMMKPWDDETLKAEIIGALRHWRTAYGIGTQGERTP